MECLISAETFIIIFIISSPTNNISHVLNGG